MREFVTDVEDPRLADYAQLTDMELRTSLESAQGLFIAEGTKVISRAVAAGYPVRSILLAERRLGDLLALPATGTPVYVVPDETAERLTGYRVHGGALASLHRKPLPQTATPATVPNPKLRQLDMEVAGQHCRSARAPVRVPPAGGRPTAGAPHAGLGHAEYASAVRIEPLPERLYDAAVRLWQDSGLTRPWNDPEADLRRAAGGGSSCVLAAIGADDGLLATAMVGHDGHRGWVYYLAVDAAQRGRGLGRQMMEACEDWVRSRGIPKIQLMVRATNRGTIGFYEHLGYADSEVVVLGRRLDG